MRDALLVAVVGGGTLAMRSAFIVGTATLGPRVARVMGNAKPAILAALVGSFLAGNGLTVQSLSALAVAAVVAMRGASMLLVIGAGVATATVLGL